MTTAEAFEVLERCRETVEPTEGRRAQLDGAYSADQLEAIATLLRAGLLEPEVRRSISDLASLNAS